MNCTTTLLSINLSFPLFAPRTLRVSAEVGLSVRKVKRKTKTHHSNHLEILVAFSMYQQQTTVDTSSSHAEHIIIVTCHFGGWLYVAVKETAVNILIASYN